MGGNTLSKYTNEHLYEIEEDVNEYDEEYKDIAHVFSCDKAALIGPLSFPSFLTDTA